MIISSLRDLYSMQIIKGDDRCHKKNIKVLYQNLIMFPDKKLKLCNFFSIFLTKIIINSIKLEIEVFLVCLQL